MGESKYIWFVFTGATPIKLLSTNKKRRLDLKKGQRFGIRPASSAKGVIRLIAPESGSVPAVPSVTLF